MQAPGATLQIPAAPGPPKMCKNCHAKPRFQAYSCCGRTCAKAYRAKKRAQATVPGGTAPPAQPGPNGMCANCKVRPTHGSHRHCGKTCASMAARQSQPHNVPVIGYSAGYQVPPSPSYSPYGPPSPGYPGYPPQGYGYSPGGPPYPYSPGPPMHPSPRGFGHPQRGGSRPPPPRRTPNRAPPRSRLSVAATDYGSEDEYPSESSDDDRRRPARRPISRREEEDSPSGSDSGYPTSEEEEQGDRRRRDDRRRSSAQPRARPSQSRAASSSRGDGLCIVCRRFPKHSGHPFCSRQCRDSLSLSQAQGIAPYPPRSDVPPAYSDTEDR